MRHIWLGSGPCELPSTETRRYSRRWMSPWPWSLVGRLQTHSTISAGSFSRVCHRLICLPNGTPVRQLTAAWNPMASRGRAAMCGKSAAARRLRTGKNQNRENTSRVGTADNDNARLRALSLSTWPALCISVRDGACRIPQAPSGLQGSPIVEVPADFDHNACQRGDQLEIGLLVIHEHLHSLLVMCPFRPKASRQSRKGPLSTDKTKPLPALAMVLVLLVCYQPQVRGSSRNISYSAPPSSCDQMGREPT